MKASLFSSLLSVFGLLVLAAQDRYVNVSAQPNIIIILADDLGYADVGFNDCQDIPTPNIDRIAAEGVKFPSAYVSYPVCGPSRAGIITGRYQDRFGFGRNPLYAPNDPNMGLPLSEETLADALKKADYKTIALGKWHLGAHESLRPNKRGFDEFFGFLSGGHSYFPEEWVLENEYQVSAQFDSYRIKLLRNNKRVEEDTYLTDALSREAVAYINQYKDQPFFMYLAYNAPHGPLQATQQYLDRFNHIENSKRKTYAAMVSALDDGVGAILNQLESLDLLQNTLIFFLSDNGGPEQHNASDNGILRGGKSDLFEGGVRVPFAMMWPEKISPNTTYENPIIALDIFATSIAQSSKPIVTKNPLDGVNLIPYLNGKINAVPHNYFFWRKFDQKDYAIRNANGDKLVNAKSSLKLFDLNANISEENKKAQTNTALQNSLLNTYSQWNAQLKDPVFLGLGSDLEYNTIHPDRYVNPNKD